MPQYSCDGKGILEFREDIGQNARTFLSVNPTTRVATITTSCPIAALNAVTNHFKKINWATGACASELAHASKGDHD